MVEEDPLIFTKNMSLVSGLKYLAKPITREDAEVFYKPVPFGPDPAPFPKRNYSGPPTYLCYRFVYLVTNKGDIPIDRLLRRLLINKEKVELDQGIVIELMSEESQSGYFCVCHDKDCCVLYWKDEFFTLLRNFLLAFAEINPGVYRDEAFRVIKDYGMEEKTDEGLFHKFIEQDEIMKTDEQRRLDVFKPEWWRDNWVSDVIKNSDGYHVTFDPAAHRPQDVTVVLSDENYQAIDRDPSKFSKTVVKAMVAQKVIVK